MPKFHVRVAALGALDEANAVIGVALLYIEDARVKDILIHVQNDLFDLGADLSRPEREYRKAAPYAPASVRSHGSKKRSTR